MSEVDLFTEFVKNGPWAVLVLVLLYRNFKLQDKMLQTIAEGTAAIKVLTAIIEHDNKKSR